MAAVLLALPGQERPLLALPEASGSLADVSLEDLMKIEVTSVSRKRQPVSRSAAAVFVITRDDIARSGASTIPDALRMAPGLMVARIDSNKWAIGSRGSAGRYANKMLVLIDGRTVYNPLYSGVYWEQHDTLIEDIDRIEVIRGPGGAMWGANAVNGVINIITRSAARTEGLLAAAGTGTHDRGFGSLRYGAEAGEAVHWRAFTKHFDRGPLRDVVGGSAGDSWNSLRGGARLDWEASPRDSVALHGDLYRGGANESIYRNLLLPDEGEFLRSPMDFW